MKTGPKPRPTIDRLLEKVSVVDDCWVFTGAIGSSGYGKTYHLNKAMDAHRVAWMIFIGDIPADMVVCHSCDVKACVNPDHLWIGTQADNIKDMYKKFRHAHGKSLSDAIKKGWTPEKRIVRGKQSSDRAKNIRIEKAKRAGVPADWKYCPKCHDWMPLSSFGSNPARYDGVNSYCVPCRRA